MHFIPEKLDDYIVTHSENEPDLLQQLTRETFRKILQPRMSSGPYQGRVLSMISKLINPKHILEIGTFTGYSTLCLTEGLQPKGALDTIDKNEELYEIQRTFFDKSKYGSLITQHLGNALEVIPTLNKTYDLIFIDADKDNYVHYFNLIINKLKVGGIILSDNVLWSGKVIKTLDPKDKMTKAVLDYNALLKNDSRVETVVLPIRDGLTISRKR